MRAIVEVPGGVTPFVVCPSCGRRARLARTESLARTILYGFGGVVAAAATLGVFPLVLVAGFAAGGLVGAATELGSWRRGRRVSVVRQLRAPRQLGLPEAYLRRRPRDDDQRR